jgi:phosphoenolpyruvate carboxylase
VAKHYAELCSDSEIGVTTYQNINNEFEDALAHLLQVTENKQLMQDFTDIAQSIQWRNAYLDPLNYIQISLLKRLNKEPSRMDNQWLAPTLATINGIATGLRNTG